MITNSKNSLYLVFGMVLLIYSFSYMTKINNILTSQAYRGNEGKTAYTVNAKLIGAKKAAVSMLWIKQILRIGSLKAGYKEIKKRSEEMSYLDPYFVGNYYLSGGIISFINVYKKYLQGILILKRGILYNPQNKYLRKYIAGIIAYSDGRSDLALQHFEEVLEGIQDARLLNVVAYTYMMKYERTKKIKYIKKSIYYWKEILKTGEDNYMKYAVEYLKKYNR